MPSTLPPIGFAAGVLERTHPTPELLDAYLEAGADAIELHIQAQRLMDGGWQDALAPTLARFRWVSIHAPKVDSPDALVPVLRALRSAACDLPVLRVTVHPEPDLPYAELEAATPLFAVENMDRRKAVGTDASLFRWLAAHTQLPFVLDLQHAYEHDPSLALADTLSAVMGRRLSHFHVSGEAEGRIHAPLTEATNADPILGALKRLEPRRPIILEGEWGNHPDPLGGLAAEIRMVCDALSEGR